MSASNKLVVCDEYENAQGHWVDCHTPKEGPSALGRARINTVICQKTSVPSGDALVCDSRFREYLPVKWRRQLAARSDCRRSPRRLLMCPSHRELLTLEEMRPVFQARVNQDLLSAHAMQLTTPGSAASQACDEADLTSEPTLNACMSKCELCDSTRAKITGGHAFGLCTTIAGAGAGLAIVLTGGWAAVVEGGLGLITGGVATGGTFIATCTGGIVAGTSSFRLGFLHECKKMCDCIWDSSKCPQGAGTTGVSRANPPSPNANFANMNMVPEEKRCQGNHLSVKRP